MMPPDPSPTHQTVKSLYEAFPYPDIYGVGFDPHRRAMINYHASRCAFAPLQRGCRILVAGCGTNEALHWALCFPDSEIIGIDLSTASLEITRQHARQLGIQNLTVQTLDILDAASLPGSPFDFISSYGVLHHMADPAAGLAALRAVLAPRGLMHLMVYNSTNRHWVQIIQTLVTDLCHDPADIAERFDVAKRLVKELAEHKGNYLQYVAQEALKELARSEAHFMDAYAHPQEQSYTIATLLPWLAGVGLRFAGWTKPRGWNPCRVVDDPDLLARLERMPSERRYHFIDQTRQPLFEFFAEPADIPAHTRPCDEDDALFWQRIPQPLAFGKHEMEQGRLTGRQGFCQVQRENVPAPPGSTRPHARVWVDPANDMTGHPILLRLLDAIDGRQTMEELARVACVAEGVELEAVRPTLRLMFQGLLVEAACIDIDPEQCQACRHRTGVDRAAR